MRALWLLPLLFAAACYDAARCRGDADCPSGACAQGVCLTRGDGGGGDGGAGCSCTAPQVCVAGGCADPVSNVVLLAPGPGAAVGAQAAVAASAEVATAGSAPGTLRVRLASAADAGEATGDIPLDGVDGGIATYRGPVGTSPVPDGPARLTVSAGTAQARASEGVVVDRTPPVLLSVAAGCDAGSCVRDEVAQVSVALAELHAAPSIALGVEGFDGGFTLPLAGADAGTATYAGPVDLAAVPFPRASADLGLAVNAVDAVQNAASFDGGAISVTRVRWQAGANAATAPATDVAAGTIWYGEGASLVSLDAATGSVRASVNVGQTITQPPSLSAADVWIADSANQLLFAEKANPSALTSAIPSFNSPALGPPAVTDTSPAGPVAAVSTSAGVFVASTTVDFNGSGPQPSGSLTGPAIFRNGDLVGYSVDAGGAGYVQRWAYDTSLHNWPAGGSTTFGVAPSSPFSWPFMGATNELLAGAQGPHTWLADVGTSTTAVTDTQITQKVGGDPSIPESNEGVVLEDGTVVASAGGTPLNQQLFRLTPPAMGSTAWGSGSWVSLSAELTGLLAVRPDAAGVVAYATQANGELSALDAGGVAWSWAPCSPGALNPPGYYELNGRHSLVLTCAVSPGGVYLLAIDSALAQSPWPKWRHDAENTGDASASLP